MEDFYATLLQIEDYFVPVSDQTRVENNYYTKGVPAESSETQLNFAEALLFLYNVITSLHFATFAKFKP